MEKSKKVTKKKYRSSKYKASLVLELLRGEPIELLARRESLTIAELTEWKQIFIQSGQSGFSSKSKQSSKDLQAAYNLIANQAMELALYKKKLQLLNTMPVK